MRAILAPQQERSARSLTRLLDAAERLMADANFEDISISEIAAEADTSVGNFYARFASKEQLLDALHERYEADRTKLWQAFFSDESVKRMKLEARIRALIGLVIKTYRARRGVFRSLVARQWRDSDQLSKQSRQRLAMLYDESYALLSACRDEIAHDDPQRAIRIGATAVLAACRETIVLRPKRLPASLEVSDAELADELSNLFYSYLTSAASRRAPKSRTK